MAGILAGAVALGVGVGMFLNGGDEGVSPEVFIAQADAVCQPANASLSVDQPADYAGLAGAAATVAAAAEGQVARLRALPVPGGGPGTHARMLVSDLDVIHQSAVGLQDAATRSDAAATVAAVNQLTTASASASGVAGALGMSECGTGLQASVQSLVAGSQAIVKTVFLAQADAACRAAAEQYADLPTTFETRADLLEYLDAALAVSGGAMGEIRALPVPPGDEAVLAEIWAAADAADDTARAIQAAAINRNQAAFVAGGEELPELTDAFDAKLDAYGMVACGSGFGDL